MTDGQLDYSVLDMFSDKAFGGCPTGVVTSAGALDQRQMQIIASELATPRTAFITGGAAGLFKAMFFTPSNQLPYSTLAALGAAVVIAQQDKTPAGSESRAITISTITEDIKTKISPLPKNGRFSLGAFLPRPSFAHFGYNLALLSGALGIDQNRIPSSWPMGLGFAGTWNLVVPMVTPQALQEARPDMEALSDLTKKIQCQSAILYTHQGPNEILCRTLSPAIGITQSMSTTALGAMSALLTKESAVTLDSPSTIITAKAHQNHREPQATIQIYGAPEKITALQVTGMCVEVLKGKVPIPT